ncbi:MAG: T9SS-dependent M36 family metallopeptidase [Bacteroidetes bacterium]|nr:T9SS-dependent M36 family metallopeptidase [Bacteroidota bacterium]
MMYQRFTYILGLPIFVFMTSVMTTFGQNSIESQLRSVLFSSKTSANEVPADFQIQKTVADNKRNLTFYYLRQMHEGLPILNGTAVVVQKNGSFYKTGDRFILQPMSVLSKSDLKSKEAVLDLVWEQLDGTKSPVRTVLLKKKGIETLQNSFYSENEIPVSDGIYFDGQVYKRVYEISIEMKDHLRWLSIFADAETGEILYQNNWIVSCSANNCSIREHVLGSFDSKNSHFLQMAPAPAPPPASQSYRVIPIPSESPVHGDFELVASPFDVNASPFGWHDDDGLPGHEYTITRGNNVYASEDTDDDNQPGFSPDGGANLSFDFPITNTNDPSTYLDAAITNLFYMNNIMHDVWYQYGFDEQSGNFQSNNYGNGGAQGDYVQAEAQDGSGTNNANFGTPPDGFRPRMQMYLWNPNGPSQLLSVNPPSSLAGTYTTGRANFGQPITSTPFSGDMALAYDSSGGDFMDACQQIVGSFMPGKIALVKRGGCNNDVKAMNCENAGAIGMVVMTNGFGNPEDMNESNPLNVTIPSVMVTRSLGFAIIAKLQADETVNITLYDHGWNGVTDSDLDNGIIAHEYGHGISNRLTGGASNSNCLSNDEQMGEGWSDWFGLMLTIKPTDVADQRRGIGTYVSLQSNDGPGIRPRPYSTSFGVNNFTYGSTNLSSISRPHGIGFIWSTMLWDMAWALIDKYGYDPDVYAGTGGNNRAMELVINGLKMQPCRPGFVDGRDAILEANALIYDSIDQCMLWKVFATRGLGANADQGSATSRTDQVEDFSMPGFCTLGLDDKQIIEESLRIFPNPTNGEITISVDPTAKMDEISIVDLNGRTVKTIKNVSGNQTTINLNQFNSGIYFVTILSNDNKITRKIVKN